MFKSYVLVDNVFRSVKMDSYIAVMTWDKGQWLRVSIEVMTSEESQVMTSVNQKFLKSKFFDFWRSPKACISPLSMYSGALNTKSSEHIFVYNVHFFLWCLVMTVKESTAPIALKGTDFWCRVPLNATPVISEIELLDWFNSIRDP